MAGVVTFDASLYQATGLKQSGDVDPLGRADLGDERALGASQRPTSAAITS